MARAIDFYFDFASPYGFIAAMKMDAIAEKIGRTVNWRPFLLGAVYKKFGQSPLEHPLKRDYVMSVDAPRIARLSGLALKVPAGFPEHSLPPARAFYWIEARSPAKAAHFARTVYAMYWLDGQSTSDAAIVVDAAAHLGFNRDEIAAGLQEPTVKARVMQENDEALSRGVFGSPFMFVDGEPFWGSDRLDLIAATK